MTRFLLPYPPSRGVNAGFAYAGSSAPYHSGPAVFVEAYAAGYVEAVGLLERAVVLIAAWEQEMAVEALPVSVARRSAEGGPRPARS